MWIGAIGAMLFLWLSRSSEEDVEPALEAPGIPVRGPADRAPDEERAGALEPLEVGAPTTYRLDRRHRGQSPYVGPDRAIPAWSFETGSRITAQPVAAADGRIYVGSHDGFLYALDEHGNERWRKDLRGPVWSTPAIDEAGNVYVGSDAKVVTALSRDGEVLWRLDVEDDADTGIVFAPNGRLHFGAGQDLWSVEPDGTVAWRYHAAGKIFTTPAVDDDGTLYFGCQDDHLYAVAPDGRLRWQHRTGDDVDSSPVLGDDGNLYFGSDDHQVRSLDRDGNVRWSTDLEGYVRAPVGIAKDGSILAGVYGPRPRLVALDPAEGGIRWFFPVTVADSTEVGVESGALVDAEGNIYFGAHDDYLYALAPTGDMRFIHGTDGDVDSSPVLTSTGLLLFGSEDGFLHALRVED
ncbi:MAG: hypothetical protein CMN30_23025 [Sandaracinus sp.]|nr:hypothetical protein [Sandaracinus sp.]